LQRIAVAALVLASAASGCGADAKRPGDGLGGAPNTGGAIVSGGAPSGPLTGGSGGVPSTGGAAMAGGAGPMEAGGFVATAGSPGMGGASAGTGGSSSSGGANGTGGASGGAAGRGGAAGSFPTLSVYGNTTTLELAPVLLAAKSVYPGTAKVANGGIPNLWSGGDLATNAETQALVQSVTHPNLRIILTVCEGFYRIVARRSAGIATLADLRGKRISTVPSTSSAYYLHEMLATANLAETDVTVVPAAAPSQMPGSLSRHDVDAITIWEPEIQNAADALGSDAIEFQDRSVYRELFDLHTTADKLANPDTRRGIVEFLRSLITASSSIQAQPSSVWPLVASTTGFDPALVAKSWPNEGFPGALVPDLLDVLTEEEAWVAKNAGRTPRSRDELGKLIDATPLMEAMTP
jgi:NitT/TauT family transport system substrate-binding protein